MSMVEQKFRRLHRLGMISAMVWGLSLAPGSLWEERNLLMEDLSKENFAFGDRKVYYDPIDGSDDWRGGAKKRWYLNEVFAIDRRISGLSEKRLWRYHNNVSVSMVEEVFSLAQNHTASNRMPQQDSFDELAGCSRKTSQTVLIKF